MKLAIMQPYFLPYMGYFQMMREVDVFVILDDVNFMKKGFIHRNSILSQGKSQRFTIPVEGMSQNKLISQMSFKLENNTKKKLLSTIQHCYQKAPYFLEINPMLNEIFQYSNLNIPAFIGNSIEEISSHLGIEAEIIYSSQLNKKEDTKGVERILDICKILKADNYINAIGGQTLYQKEEFEKEGIILQFIKMDETIEYSQFGEDFVPYLSVLDAMMFCSVTEMKQLLEKYTLI